MKKMVYVLTVIITVFLFHYQIFAQQTEGGGFKTVIKSERIMPNVDATSYVCDYETIPKENHLFITAEYNTGIKQETNVTQLEHTTKKYVDIATSELKQIYGADAILSLRSEVKTNENGEMIIVIAGVPVKWTNFKPIAEYNREKNTTKQVNNQNRDILGVDFGVGSIVDKNMIYDNYGNRYKIKSTCPVFAVGLRYLHHFNPYFGVDVMKINFNCPFRAQTYTSLMNLQFMTGIRGNSPSFLKSMSVYGAVRMGYGLHFSGNDEFSHGIALETEVGLNLTRTFFIAFSYNLQSSYYDLPIYGPWGGAIGSETITLNLNTYALRLGFNF
jgi:hypothetical protein